MATTPDARGGVGRPATIPTRKKKTNKTDTSGDGGGNVTPPPSNPPAGNTSFTLPGTKGSDYVLYTYGGKTYAVYTVKLPTGGGAISMGWSVDPKSFDTSGAKKMTSTAFKAMQFFGSAGDIADGVGALSGKHPFQKYLASLEDQFGPVSWFHDKQYMGTVLMGAAEGWDAGRLAGKLKQTDWYQSHTATQREWETLGKSDQASRVDSIKQQMKDQLVQLYGTTGFDAQTNPTGLDGWAKDVASGLYGDPNDGMAIWFAQRKTEAQQVEGSNAWVDASKETAARNAFANQPEVMAENLRNDALAWLGPRGQLDDGTINAWANDMVTQTKSQADWDAYMQSRAKSLYPWLDANEKWQDRASSYKKIAEDQLGTTIKWDDGLLGALGGVDGQGAPTGAIQTYDQFTKTVRQDDRFWNSAAARQEGFDLLSKLNNTMNGVS